MSDAATLCTRVREIQGILSEQVKAAQWSGLSSTLRSLSQTAEYAGQKNLCLQAQALSELIGHRGGGRADEPGARVLELMEQLFAGLSHWGWSLDETVQAGRLSHKPSSLTH